MLQPQLGPGGRGQGHDPLADTRLVRRFPCVGGLAFCFFLWILVLPQLLARPRAVPGCPLPGSPRDWRGHGMPLASNGISLLGCAVPCWPGSLIQPQRHFGMVPTRGPGWLSTAQHLP